MSGSSRRTLSLAVCALLAFGLEISAQSADRSIIQLRIARTRAAPGYAPRQLADTTFYVSDSILVSDADIEHADMTRRVGRLAILIRITTQGAQRLAVATKSHIGDRMAMLLDRDVIGAPTIVSGISGPTVELDVGPPAPIDRIAAEILARWPTHQ
jgi:preprotein translocase subunit SecD